MQKYAFPVIIGLVILAMFGLFAAGNNSSPQPSNGKPNKVSNLRETRAPWSADNANLAATIAALGLPPTGTEKFHQHALMQIFIDGKRVVVPKSIGVGGGAVSSLHTHNEDGAVHMESEVSFPFKLGQLFDVWGVKFAKDQLGAYKDKDNKRVQVYVNGVKLVDPASYLLKEKDKIVVGYGTTEQVPTTNSDEFPKNL